MTIQPRHTAHLLCSAALLAALSSGIVRAQEVQSTAVPSFLDIPDKIAPFSIFPRGIVPPPGLRIEMSVAPPADNMPHTPYELGKYGRITVEYSHLTTLDGSYLGMAAQALHVAHHLLFYSAGLTSDINNDGM